MTIARSIQVHGHRGARARYPENTLAGFEYAARIGADTLELDVHVTKDGVLVVHHDPRINANLCLGPGHAQITNSPLIRDLALQEVRAFDCGSLRNPDFTEQKTVPGERIPTLQEVFDRVPQARFLIEIKSEPEHPEYSPEPDEFARLVIDCLRKNRMPGRAVIQSFDYRTLEETRKLDSKATIALLTETAGEDFISSFDRERADILSTRGDLLTPEIIRAVHERGGRVSPWTINLPEHWRILTEMGVDGIITDDPEALIAWCHARPTL